LGPFRAAAWNPYNWLACIDSDRRMFVFDEKGSEVFVFVLPFDFGRVAFSPVGDRFAAWAPGESVLVYDVPKALRRRAK
jgi:hypothetical protein